MKYTIRRVLFAPVLTLITAGSFVYIHLTLISLGAEPTATLGEVYQIGLALGVGASLALLFAPRPKTR